THTPHTPSTYYKPNIPALHLPGSNLQSSRLRYLLNYRDIHMDEFDILSDYDQQQQLINELACLSPHHLNSNSLSHFGRMKPLNPSNLTYTPHTPSTSYKPNILALHLREVISSPVG
ncbi:hypothetical protein RYX36_008156, partial [Vicia faba]